MVHDTDRTTRWRQAGLEIAQTLVADAVWSDGMCGFHGAAAGDSVHAPPRFRSMGADVYEGSAGIARFLGRAAVLSGADDLRDTAVGALRHALTTVEGWSLFGGAMGVGVTAAELAVLLDQPQLMGEGIRLVGQALAAAVEDGDSFDLLLGTAGVIVGVGAVGDHDRNGTWRSAAFELGELLLAGAVADGPAEPGGPPLSWPLCVNSDVRLCGLAHGASGVALALQVLAALAPEDGRWADAARRARAFERGHYSAAAGSWADLREPENGTSYPHMWCHGSIGVVAERLGVLSSDLLARADVAGGLAGLRAHAANLLARSAGPGAGDEMNASLCHGLSGFIDVLIDASAATADTRWSTIANDLADLMLNDARRRAGWRSGVPGGWTTPGLMLGLAGTGWALLRAAEPEVVPSGWRVGQL